MMNLMLVWTEGILKVKRSLKACYLAIPVLMLPMLKMKGRAGAKDCIE